MVGKEGQVGVMLEGNTHPPQSHLRVEEIEGQSRAEGCSGQIRESGEGWWDSSK